jgi:type IV secretory pathway TraG/TraD family ATPase VirD4
MAGFGMQLWAIIQDLSQLEDLYGRRWQTFLGNAGVLQVFGTRDMMTADYVSRLAGHTTVEQISKATQDKRDGGFLRAPDPNYASMNDRQFGRPLIQPEEVIRLPDFIQILFLPSCNPIECRKVPYYENARYYDNEGYPLFRPNPHFAFNPVFYVWDQETMERRKNVNEERVAQERAEREARRQEELAARAEARREAMDKAAKVTGEAAKMAGKFGKRLLDEAKKARDARKDDPDK